MFDLERVARITGGVFSGKKVNCGLSGISTDSRNMEPGALFVPLRGEHFDGHDYLSQAVKNGAAACLSEEIIEGLSVPVVRVENTLQALGDLAAAYRLQLNGPLVAITGSAGKTTTKEMLASILEQVGPGLKTAGNFNNLIGLPLTVFRMQPEHQWAVLEMGTSSLGEIERLTEIAQPTVGLITNIGQAHLESLHGLDGVARAKGELFAGMQGGSAIINLDDERVARLPVANGVFKLTYGLAENAQVRAENVRVNCQKLEFDLHYQGEVQHIELGVAGQHNVSNALAAAAAALVLKVSLKKVAIGLKNFIPVQGRMNLMPMPCGGLLIDDSYNANPLSVAAALKVLANTKGQGRRVAVLGDMLELGDGAAEMHREIGRQAGEFVDLLVAVGNFSADICAGAGLKAEQMIELSDVDAAIALMQEKQRPGDRVLVKGSRGIKLDRLADALRAAAEELPNGQQGS
ncbi:UDP-N-acetylmuramoyl-tripeptide--D-alanyl-D-alanine ligase [Malonomonas rubra DSM 5091]|uniref:UDP-N-acetylmuramoyl-tripeptide--D-alanyl-D-alanine ligase n=1 Tax=Malonomonas rubra DSM 5091 TaxID=1122189 RepID=A0A1M6E6E0_MALRU|nr:UDP-N-acetylmuramoyl-tripeptide--D-alanyl-D-alanine ligase [Malonomonas rubra]SHI80930.1 UDP-N-acetylmuramoyl-tripeptide--D-alanyl-D-alanine ligase [Malonomonas rubra DSM 5091]